MRKEVSTRDYSKKQEQAIANYLRGKVQTNSGGTKFGGGDVHTKYFLIEAKTVEYPQKSFNIKKEWIKKAEEQAYQQRKYFSAVAFRFEPQGEDYFIINKSLMRALVNYLEDNDG